MSIETHDDAGSTVNLVRSLVYAALVGAILIWTVYYLVGGYLAYRQIVDDASGRTMIELSRATLGNVDLSTTWSDPESRRVLLNDFTAAFWDARLRFWLMPTLGLGMIALLIKR